MSESRLIECVGGALDGTTIMLFFDDAMNEGCVMVWETDQARHEYRFEDGKLRLVESRGLHHDSHHRGTD